ncbi:MAG: TetR/AcrR family transcriptional regulator [Acidimicrobiia bacterium]|nr:TetR/AcrR family transcriptional regulator [Acidimicrobiia bacterium]
MTTRRTAGEIVEAVTSAAGRLLLERSPSAVSMRDIAAEADVNLGLIHRYVGSKDDVIALVLSRHSSQARTALRDIPEGAVLERVAAVIVDRPGTGPLIAGLILDGVDVTTLKGDFPLLEQLAHDGAELQAAITYALALGWEVFGPSLLQAVGGDSDVVPSRDELVGALTAALTAVHSGR